MFWPFKRSVDLEGYLRKTKKIKIKGISLEIRKINLEDHIAGLDVVMKLHELYKREKPKDPVKAIEDVKAIRKFMRDFIYAGVVSPKLTMAKGPTPDGAIHVDEITADMDLAQAICMAVIQYGYGKKN